MAKTRSQKALLLTPGIIDSGGSQPLRGKDTQTVLWETHVGRNNLVSITLLTTWMGLPGNRLYRPSQTSGWFQPTSDYKTPQDTLSKNHSTELLPNTWPMETMSENKLLLLQTTWFWVICCTWLLRFRTVEPHFSSKYLCYFYILSPPFGLPCHGMRDKCSGWRLHLAVSWSWEVVWSWVPSIWQRTSLIKEFLEVKNHCPVFACWPAQYLTV